MLVIFALAVSAAEPIEIPVVRTWRDLAEAPEIKLLPTPDGDSRGTVRVGIEAVEAPGGSRVLLYALAKDCIDNVCDRDRLGPLWIKTSQERPEELMKAVALDEATTWKHRLFTRSVRVPDGICMVSLFDGSREVAKVKIAANAIKFQHWRTLELPKDTEIIGEEHHLTNVGDDIAFPDEDDFPRGTPVSDEKLSSDESLPRLLTSDDRGEDEEQFENDIAVLLSEFESEWYCDRITADERLFKYGARCLPFLRKQLDKADDGETRVRIGNLIERLNALGSLEFKDGQLHLRFGEKVDIGEDLLLVRYWVNGTPFTSQFQNDEIEKMAREYLSASEMIINLHLDLKQLNAVAGDRITLQLLYCPEGRRRGDGSELQEALKKLVDHRRSLCTPIITNKAEFIAK
ncbi:MAG TPA: hypothetical protein VEJ63_09970 [Planctomycetota bacterium]|nr:hypothetical protein [Planctomycetota bacterium]